MKKEIIIIIVLFVLFCLSFLLCIPPNEPSIPNFQLIEKTEAENENEGSIENIKSGEENSSGETIKVATPHIFEDGFIHGLTTNDATLYASEDFTNIITNIRLNSNINIYPEEYENAYKINYNGQEGFIKKELAKFFVPDISSEFVLGCDVSGFNFKREFFTKEDFEAFLLKYDLNYAYIRLGGRGYGVAGNMYLDEKVDIFVEACEYLGVPYGFYFLDEAVKVKEIYDEYDYIKEGLKRYNGNYNLLPLALDMENQHGDGRADNAWPNRVQLVNLLIEEFQKDNIECIVYANGARIETYLKDLNCYYWTAAYTLDDKIPKVFYDEFIRNEEEKNKKNPANIENSILNTKVNLGDTETIWYSDNYLNKVMGWQFTESAAKDDGIEGTLDLNLFKTRFIMRKMN